MNTTNEGTNNDERQSADHDLKRHLHMNPLNSKNFENYTNDRQIMEKYEFSRHSYDRLKQFLDVVENNVADHNRNPAEIEKLKKLFPLDTELINKLSGHTLTQDDIIEVHSSPDSPKDLCLEREIENLNNTNKDPAMDIGNPINAEITTIPTVSKNNQETNEQIEQIILFLNEMLDLQNEDAMVEMITTLDKHEQHVERLFGQLQEHPNVLNMAKFIATCDNSKIVQAYCDSVLNKHIINGTEGVYMMLQEFFENQPQVMCSTLAKCLLVITDDHNLSKEFPHMLLWIPSTNKVNILGTFLYECSQMNKTQMKIVNNLLHEQMELSVVRMLLSLLLKNMNSLATDRYYGLLLENLMRKCNKNLLQVKEEVGILINHIPGILKLKLFKILKTAEDTSDNSFSEAMQY